MKLLNQSSREDLPTEQTAVKQQIGTSLYGKALQDHLGFPKWFYESQNELRRLGIKGEAQIAIARITTPEQIKSIYSRLEKNFIKDTNSFMASVPWVFTYKNSYLESYVTKLMQVVAKLYSKFGYKLPKEFDWKYSPDSFKDLEVSLANWNSGAPEIEKLLKLREDLKVYEGKRILLLGVRTDHQQATLRKYLPSSAKLTFHKGENIRGLTGQYFNYDIIVFTGGVATHKIDMIVKSAYGTDFSTKRINAFDQVNPERVLTVMAENAYRFRGR